MARGPTRKVQEAHALRALSRNPLGILTFRPDDRLCRITPPDCLPKPATAEFIGGQPIVMGAVQRWDDALF
jgi:uncharacterized membrane protein